MPVPDPCKGQSSAKPVRGEYRRNLPHLQPDDRTFYVTFCTQGRWLLPEEARSLVLEHCVHDHGTKIWVHGAVVMPDHVHMVFTPLRDSTGATYSLAEIMSGIKGASAHHVNRVLGRTGHVWQAESFDHVLRSDQTAEEKVEYMCANPVRRGLVKRAEEYPWMWRESEEGCGHHDPSRDGV